MDKRIKDGRWKDYRDRLKESKNQFKICPICGLSFVYHAKKKYCSYKCRKISWLDKQSEENKLLRHKIVKMVKDDGK